MKVLRVDVVCNNRYKSSLSREIWSNIGKMSMTLECSSESGSVFLSSLHKMSRECCRIEESRILSAFSSALKASFCFLAWSVLPISVWSLVLVM